MMYGRHDLLITLRKKFLESDAPRKKFLRRWLFPVFLEKLLQVIRRNTILAAKLDRRQLA
jgi:hypothetical protein